MFKCQLQQLCHKAGLGNPIYDVTKKEGPAHEPQFKAAVMIKGVRYESPTTYGSLRKAEHAAAEVALQKIAKANEAHMGTLHESGLCKNLLQEYAQKGGMGMPRYCIVKTGGDHAPSFFASVEVSGVQYKGESCKNKKQAEIKAARAALVAIYAASGTALQGTPKQVLKGEPTSLEVEPASIKVEPTSFEVEEPSTEEPASPPAACLKMESPPPAEVLSGAKRKRELEGADVGRDGNGQKSEIGDNEEVNNEESVKEQETVGVEDSGHCDGIPGITDPGTTGVEEQHTEA